MKILILASYSKSLINFRGTLLKAMVDAGHTVLACAPDTHAETVAKLQKIGVAFCAVPMQRTGTNPLRDLQSVAALYSVFRDAKPDILLAYTFKPVIYGSLAARLAGVPKRYSMITGLGNSFSNPSLKGRILSFAIRCLFRLAIKKNTAIFFQNPDDKRDFENWNLIGKNTQAVMMNGSGVDLDYYPAVPPVKKTLVFLLMARLIKEKGLFEYASAAQTLSRRYPQVAFRLLGSFDSNPSAIQKAQVEEWQKNGIEYCGETADVRPFIADSSVYVLPSFYREGVPRSILEAMAMGRPIITTDSPGCRETVVEGQNGFLVPPQNAEALTQAMERFITQPELIDSMGKASRAMAEDKYDVHKVNTVVLQTMNLQGK